MRKLMFFLTFLSVTIIASANSNKDFYIGKWNVEIKGTPGGDSNLLLDLRKSDGDFKGTVYSKKDGTVEIQEVEFTEEGIQIRFKSGWFTVELLMAEKDLNHCNCTLAGRYKGASERIIQEKS